MIATTNPLIDQAKQRAGETIDGLKRELAQVTPKPRALYMCANLYGTGDEMRFPFRYGGGPQQGCPLRQAQAAGVGCAQVKQQEAHLKAELERLDVREVQRRQVEVCG